MKRKYLMICLLGGALSLSSCKDFLDLEPKSAPTDQNFWKTQDDANAAVNATYALLRSALNDPNGITHFAYGDLMTDEIGSTNNNDYSFVVNGNLNRAFASSDTGNPLYRLRRYDNFYRIIDQANRVIARVPKMEASAFTSESRRNTYLGEAYFMRAFTYFYMTRIWGGVPLLVDEVTPIDATHVPASTAEQVIAQINSDIAKAKELLSWSNLSNSVAGIRANKGAVFALEAHVQAWTGNFAASASAADSVIRSNDYFYVSRDSLAYRNMYRGQSAETIFEVSMSQNNEGTRQGIGQYTLVAPYQRMINTPTLTITPARVRELFKEKEDKRLKYAFDTTINVNYVILTKYANLTYTNETNNAVPIYKNNILIFRYSDIKLLRAEALAATGRASEAEEILNEVRMQAGLPEWDGSGTLIKAIFDERARELFMEGHRYYDLVRLYKYHGIYEFPNNKMSVAQFNAGKYIWPFDPTLLNQNPLLRQTPYWATVSM
jgi:hypothetical protein